MLVIGILIHQKEMEMGMLVIYGHCQLLIFHGLDQDGHGIQFMEMIQKLKFLLLVIDSLRSTSYVLCNSIWTPTASKINIERKYGTLILHDF